MTIKQIKDSTGTLHYIGAAYDGNGNIITNTYVDLTSEEKITGQKTFINGLYVGGAINSWGDGAAGSGYIEYDGSVMKLGCYNGAFELSNDTAYFYKDEVKKEIAPLDHTHPYVDLTSAQTIGGVKTFTDSIIIGDATLTYDDTSTALVISFD